MRFTPSFSAVLWDPPATAGVLSGLLYEITLKKNGTDEPIVDKNTTNTSCPLPDLQRCQYYTANVAVFYKDYSGSRVVFGQKIPGGK